MDREPISAIVIAKNEEAKIGRCLSSLKWVDEVIVVDSGSTDKTKEIVKSFDNAVLVESEWLGYSKTKTLAIEHSKNLWILWVDSDEVIPPEMKQKIKDLSLQVCSKEQVTAYSFARKNYVMGKFVRFGGWYPDRVTRLFHKSYCEFDGAYVHEKLILKQGRVKNIKTPILHDSYSSFPQYLMKNMRYAEEGARERHAKGKKTTVLYVIFVPFWAFFKSYFIKLGIFDGYTGFLVSLGTAYHKFAQYAALRYLNRYGALEKSMDRQKWED